ncbi:hypothetical protein HGM15179_005891, partial [Zosterops borbonicus]
GSLRKELMPKRDLGASRYTQERLTQFPTSCAPLHTGSSSSHHAWNVPCTNRK